MLLGFKRACASGLEARDMLGLEKCVIAGAVLVVVLVVVAYGIVLRHIWVCCIPRKAGKISCFGFLLPCTDC